MGLATLSSPQSLIKTVLRGLFQIPRAILALPSPSNSAISLYCLIFSPGLYVGIDAILVTTSIPAINFPIIFQFNSHKTNSYNNNKKKKKSRIRELGIVMTFKNGTKYNVLVIQLRTRSRTGGNQEFYIVVIWI